MTIQVVLIVEIPHCLDFIEQIITFLCWFFENAFTNCCHFHYAFFTHSESTTFALRRLPLSGPVSQSPKQSWENRGVYTFTTKSK